MTDSMSNVNTKSTSATPETVVLCRWESIAGCLVLSTELITQLVTVKSLKVYVSSVNPSSE